MAYFYCLISLTCNDLFENFRNVPLDAMKECFSTKTICADTHNEAKFKPWLNNKFRKRGIHYIFFIA